MLAKLSFWSVLWETGSQSAKLGLAPYRPLSRWRMFMGSVIEWARRRPHWSGDIPVVLTDDQTWYLPAVKPNAAGIPVIGERQHAWLLEAIRAVQADEARFDVDDTEAVSDFINSWSTLNACLLLANYSLDSATAFRLVQVVGDKEATNAFHEAIDTATFPRTAERLPTIGTVGDPSLN